MPLMLPNATFSTYRYGSTLDEQGNISGSPSLYLSGISCDIQYTKGEKSTQFGFEGVNDNLLIFCDIVDVTEVDQIVINDSQYVNQVFDVRLVEAIPTGFGGYDHLEINCRRRKSETP